MTEQLRTLKKIATMSKSEPIEKLALESEKHFTLDGTLSLCHNPSSWLLAHLVNLGPTTSTHQRDCCVNGTLFL